MKTFLVLCAAVLLFLAQLSCGGGSHTAAVPPPDPPPVNTPPPPPPPTYDSVPHFGHVALVVFENQKEEAILGNPFMPYLNSLAQQYSYAANYYADTHPSLGNYFMLTTGQIITNDLGFNGVVDVDNIVREFIKAGKSWKAYEESIPYTGFLGDSPPYEKTHDPAAYFSDVRNDPAQAANLVSLDQLQTDTMAGTLPNFMFIEPNQVDSMHSCTPDLPGCNCPPTGCTNDQALQFGDNWAQAHLAPLLSDPNFQKDGLLIITWDESWADSDDRNGGGHVLTILVGPNVKPQFISNTFYQHESTLRLICDAVQVPCMANGTTAPPMTEFFVGH